MKLRAQRAVRAIKVAVAVVLVLAATRCVAFEDGGGRSVFAFGAGNRALGMGGAYVAVADDASATIWNTGGLGLLTRRQVQASHTNLFGLGFSEQYFSLAVPDWRRGTFALTVRKFGVDGIEQRDDRNTLLDANLEDSETEIVLAYGRRLTDGVAVGGSFKLQRHSLAGYSDSGLGLDLGCLLRPRRLLGLAPLAGRYDWTVGLALRNAVPPAIQLDSESVADPRGIRLGSALERVMSPDLDLLAALDLEKTSGMDSRLHLGLEADYRSLLAVRVGTHAGMLTAGLGVLWRDIGVDFAFEDNPLGAVHRIGVSFKQGATVGEQRARALAAAEQERRDRLAKDMATENRRRIDDLMTQARDARDRGEEQAVLDVLGMVRILAPEHPGALALQLEVLRDQSRRLETGGDLVGAMMTLRRLLTLSSTDEDAIFELARLRTASDELAARSSEIRKVFDEAMDAFTAGDLQAAKAGFAQVVEQDADDREATAMLRRVAEAVRVRAESLVQQARALAVAGRYDEAGELLGEARRLDAGAVGMEETGGLIAQGRQEAEFEQRRLERERARAVELAALAGAADTGGSARSGGTLTSAERQELATLYQRGLTLMDEGQADEALRHWELVWSSDQEFEEVSDYLQEEYLNRGMEAYAGGRLAEAVSIWENALRVAPDDQRTRGYLERARQQLARIRELQRQDTEGGTGGVQ